VRSWAHVRVFSPWEYDIDPTAAKLLAAQGWAAPTPDGYPTGGDTVARYLEPLAAVPAIAEGLHVNARVIAVTRRGVDKLSDCGRDDAPFELRVERDGVEERRFARAVIDASGTWPRPNPLGAGGLPAVGERAVADRIAYGIPDVLDTDRWSSTIASRHRACWRRSSTPTCTRAGRSRRTASTSSRTPTPASTLSG
jgi:hypothetical protein